MKITPKYNIGDKLYFISNWIYGATIIDFYVERISIWKHADGDILIKYYDEVREEDVLIIQQECDCFLDYEEAEEECERLNVENRRILERLVKEEAKLEYDRRRNEPKMQN